MRVSANSFRTFSREVLIVSDAFQRTYSKVPVKFTAEARRFVEINAGVSSVHWRAGVYLKA